MTFKVRIVDKRTCHGAGDEGGLSYCDEELQGADEGQTGQESGKNQRPLHLRT